MTSLASGSVSIPQRRRSGLGFRDRRRFFLIALAVPAVAYIVLIALYPLVQGIWYSFFDYRLLKNGGRMTFIGLDNYVQLFTDNTGRRAIINTFVFTIGAVFFEFVLGLGLALLLWRDGRFNRICLAFLLIPVTITPLVVGLIFRALLAVDYGYIGYYLAEWGITSPRGLFAGTATALPTLIFIDIWEWTPLVALILLAGLKSLPGDILEAALADGATSWQRFKLVILPLLLPTVFLALVLRMMDAFRVFDSIFVTTGGGPADATTSLMVYGVKQGLQFFNIGYASAISNVTILCIGLMAAAFTLMIRRADVKANEQ
ncbi:sugar ABC transporter permease [Kaistia dalseonensis]|uniref:Multiple sugar transport system permease protein n=1 Tax=Kaistia dalseonensis TaxID=410840 RepID=A0ABU0HC35_9HYPH|nr:sugar ABC transporter permease [Kaistia dalseonensis]MCX5497199.1 sugar ABC transporter permease [Kaistia dalseonensis]MDQ0439830.1 multiple sugar transport system permease protein [Kaistia dalseonensis]